MHSGADQGSQAAVIRAERPVISGKFFRERASLGGGTFYVKGVTYGTFSPGPEGTQFPCAERVEGDFALMSARGMNAVRLYTPPRPDVLDEAARWGLRVMVGIPWAQHVAFLDDARLCREIRRQVTSRVGELHGHPAVLLFALGNEIPPSVVRWHGRKRVERFLRELVDDARQVAPESCFTYVNYPPTEFLELEAFDVCAFNVYLHDPDALSAYLVRLQHIAGRRPLLLAEAGTDSIREGPDGQARLTAMHVNVAFAEGLCGVFVYAWTDEWWRGGREVDDWAFGVVDRQRRPKPALVAVTRAFEEAPFPESEKRTWPKVSVVVCAYNAAGTLEDCLRSLERLNYADYEVIVVNDGSTDATSRITKAHTSDRIRAVDIETNGGLSAARNAGLAHARGEIVAYTDADVRVDPEWLTYLVQPFLRSDVVGSGGPNVVPGDDPWMAQCVARAPGGPTEVLLDDRVAEHVPGCNMAFRREALLAVGGFNPVFLRAGDDVDVCWRLQARGWRIGFAPSALVWHHHRASLSAYWRQQVGYGEGELWLAAHHPDKFAGHCVRWHGRIYSPLPFVRSLSRARVNSGVWGTAAFPSVYFTGAPAREYLPHCVQWQAAWIAFLAVGLAGLASPWPAVGAVALIAGAAMLSTTAAKCWTYALRSHVEGLLPIPGATPGRSSWRYRATIAWLHLIQPLARLRGLVRGLLNPPCEGSRGPGESAAPQPSPGAADNRRVPRLEGVGIALRLLLGETVSARFWGESWAGIETVLGLVVGELRNSRGDPILVDDGWRDDRDVSVALGPWARLDLRGLVEEHGNGRVLLRAATRLHPTGAGLVASSGLAALLAVAVLGGAGSRWPVASLAGVGLLAGAALAAFAHLVRSSAVLKGAMARAASVCGMVDLHLETPETRPWPQRLAWVFRGAVATALMGLGGWPVSSIVQGALPAMTSAFDPSGARARPPAGHAAPLSIVPASAPVRRPEPERPRVDGVRRPKRHGAPAGRLVSDASFTGLSR